MASGSSGNFQSIPALYPDNAPIPTTRGSVNLYLSLVDGQIYTVDFFKVHTLVGAGYTLPPATAIMLGGVKIGAGLSVLPDGTISVPIATAAVRGSVKIGAGISVALDGTISVTPTPAADILSFQVVIPGGVGIGTVGQYGSNPIQIIPAPGPGKFIELISASISKTWNIAGYLAGEVGLQPKLIGIDVLVRAIWDTEFLVGYLNTTRRIGQADILGDLGGSGTITQFPENDSVEITSVDGADPQTNPSGGDTGMTVYGLYRTVTIV